MESSRDRDLADVIREETSRGSRHPIKAVTLEERRRLSAAYEKMKKHSFTEDQVAEVLREAGIDPKGNHGMAILKAWREESGK